MDPPHAEPAPVNARIVLEDEVLPLASALSRPSLFRIAASTVATFAVMLGLGLVVLALAPAVFGYRPVVVASGSMEPSLRVADIVVTRSAGDTDIVTDSVINFRTESGQLIHRVVGQTPTGYRTKGDANATFDSDIVDPSAIQGVGIYMVPLVGLPAVWLEHGEWAKLVLLAIGLAAAGHLATVRFLRGHDRGILSPLTITLAGADQRAWS